MKVRFKNVLKEKGNDESCFLLCELLDDSIYTIMAVELFDDESSINFIDTYNIKLLAYVHHLKGLFKNQEEFYKQNNNHMSYESFIPMGAFPIPENEDTFRPEPIAFLNATVSNVYTNEECNAPNNILPFEISLFDNKIDTCIVYKDENEKKEEIKKGNIISAIVWFEIIGIEKQPEVS